MSERKKTFLSSLLVGVALLGGANVAMARGGGGGGHGAAGGHAVAGRAAPAAPKMAAAPRIVAPKQQAQSFSGSRAPMASGVRGGVVGGGVRGGSRTVIVEPGYRYSGYRGGFGFVFGARFYVGPVCLYPGYSCYGYPGYYPGVYGPDYGYNGGAVSQANTQEMDASRAEKAIQDALKHGSASPGTDISVNFADGKKILEITQAGLQNVTDASGKPVVESCAHADVYAVGRDSAGVMIRGGTEGGIFQNGIDSCIVARPGTAAPAATALTR